MNQSWLKRFPFEVRAIGSSEPGLLVTREVGDDTKEAVCRQLAALTLNTVMELDFSNIRFIDVSCADEVVVRVSARLEAGEFPDRFMILTNVQEQHTENIHVALKVAKKAVLVRNERGRQILGELITSFRDALESVIESKEITAKELQQKMGYATINQASTVLTSLYDKRLVARIPFPQPVQGGGRQFKYLSLV